MKKGCLFKTIFFVTIFVAIALYFFKDKYEEFIDSPTAQVTLSFLNTDLTEKFNFIKNSPQKINLEKLIEDTEKSVDLLKELPSDQIDFIRDKFDEIFSDSIITEKELNYVQDLFNKIKK